jgi:GNAT superfamily N-acetyltransferase
MCVISLCTRGALDMWSRGRSTAALDSALLYRHAQRADVAAMHALRLSVHENRLRDPSRVTQADYERYVYPSGAAWVAEEEGRLLGFAIADVGARSIWALFVAPHAERRGIGRALLSRVTEQLLKTGSGPLSLTTEPGTRAERLYVAAGWRRVGLQQNGEVRFELPGESAV